MTATTGSAEVLACPLCNSASETSTAFDGSVYEGHVVICANGKCGCQSGVFPTPAMARKAWNTRLAAKPAEDVREAIIALVETSMRDAWNDICSDTDCHPLDIVHGRGKVLSFEPMHWARFTGEAVADALSTPGQPKP